MTGFTLFFSRYGSHSKLDLKACVQNKGVVRHLFSSILTSYMSECPVLVSVEPRVCKALETNRLPKVVPGKFHGAINEFNRPIR